MEKILAENTRTCARCGDAFAIPCRRGRPHTRCPVCRAHLANAIAVVPAKTVDQLPEPAPDEYDVE